MAALLALPGYRYPITTCRSAPPLANGSKVFARIPGWFSTSFRQSIMDFTVTGIALFLPRVSRARRPFIQMAILRPITADCNVYGPAALLGMGWRWWRSGGGKARL